MAGRTKFRVQSIQFYTFETQIPVYHPFTYHPFNLSEYNGSGSILAAGS
jgi:hypothetical protein